MRWLVTILFLSALVPWFTAYRASRASSLGHALAWSLAAWLAWTMTLLGEVAPGSVASLLALALTACAGVAVLGARRPHLWAWDFVVLGLLLVVALWFLEGWFLGRSPWETLRIFFLCAILAVGVLNYLPTRLGPAALLVGLGAAGEILLAAAPDLGPSHAWAELLKNGPGRLALLALPWVAWACWRLPARQGHDFDRIWFTFRDAFGLFWGLRVRDLFNQSAHNAGASAALTWWGLSQPEGTPLSSDARAEMEAILRALLKRFDGSSMGGTHPR